MYLREAGVEDRRDVDRDDWKAFGVSGDEHSCHYVEDRCTRL